MAPKKKIRPHVQNMLTIPDSIFNMIGDPTLYDHILNTRIFALITNKIFIRTPKIMKP